MTAIDVYSPTNFRKNQSAILKEILAQNKPVEITIASEKDGPNSGVIAISKKDYIEYLQLKKQAVELATKEISEIARSQNPQHLTDQKDIEAWFDDEAE
ncbi:hypothetical protein ACFQ4L_04505 [Lapidilactobacillus mulanensis]|uniref:Antitoxin n=2 Tax=Lapidilactobacillus mulanensis TaxID=2485999 RepID=A0ABW4DN68_9LACO